ncbi:HTH_Tnp_Tc3_2 domain-containing protein [Trichonephila clavipes]|nr:HTH_Tnp_Tc3_2 domain-containing protein [Trichonephila clavipes]
MHAIATSVAFQAQVALSFGAPVSSRTIRRRLAEGHLESRRPLRMLPLTPTHTYLRLEWCLARGNWTAAEWNQGILSNANPDSISAVMTIVFVCGSPVVNTSILPLLYSDTSSQQLLSCDFCCGNLYFPKVIHDEIRVSVPPCSVVADHLLRVRHHRRVLQESRRHQRVHQAHRLQQQRCVRLHW